MVVSSVASVRRTGGGDDVVREDEEDRVFGPLGRELELALVAHEGFAPGSEPSGSAVVLGAGLLSHEHLLSRGDPFPRCGGSLHGEESRTRRDLAHPEFRLALSHEELA